MQDLAMDIVLCSWVRHFTMTLSTQVYKYILSNCWGSFTELAVQGEYWAISPIVTSCFKNLLVTQWVSWVSQGKETLFYLLNTYKALFKTTYFLVREYRGAYDLFKWIRINSNNDTVKRTTPFSGNITARLRSLLRVFGFVFFDYWMNEKESHKNLNEPRCKK